MTFFNLVSGVRQGVVLSPSLFAIYVDDIAKKINAHGIVICHLFAQVFFCMLMIYS